MAFEKGNDIKVSVGSTLIGGQQNCSINRETKKHQIQQLRIVEFGLNQKL